MTGRHTFLLLASTALLWGSAEWRGDFEGRSSARRSEPASAPAPPQPSEPPIPRWHLNGRVYSDWNRDGRIDREVAGQDAGTDGYGRYKVDTDYDGFYDREYEAGGIACHELWSRQIHEPVPRIRDLRIGPRSSR